MYNDSSEWLSDLPWVWKLVADEVAIYVADTLVTHFKTEVAADNLTTCGGAFKFHILAGGGSVLMSVTLLEVVGTET